MVNVLKKHSLSIFIATAFFLSQTLNVHANYSSNNTQKESVECVTENVTYATVGTTAFSVPTVSYGTINGNVIEGKVEKVVAEPLTIAVGVFVIGYVVSFLVGLVKDIVSIFK